MLKITDALFFEDRDITERFVRASGPGGQNVNKVATAVELRVDVRGSSLPADVKERLTKLAGSRMTAEGLLVIDSRVHRSQALNREAARARLIALVTRAERPPVRRRATRPTTGSREQRLTSKKRQSTLKRTRTRRADEE